MIVVVQKQHSRGGMNHVDTIALIEREGGKGGLHACVWRMQVSGSNRTLVVATVVIGRTIRFGEVDVRIVVLSEMVK